MPIGSVAGARDAIEAGADGLAHLSPEAVLDPETVALARRDGTFVVPTLSLNESLCGVRTGASLLRDDRLAPFLREYAHRTLRDSFRFRPPRPLDFSPVLASVARLREAQVPILAGTDAPNPGTAHGISLVVVARSIRSSRSATAPTAIMHTMIRFNSMLYA